jgi:hypothetical protein
MLEAIQIQRERAAKMRKSLKAERRLHPRIDQRLPVNIVANGYDLATTTQNVSCVGAYCHVQKYIPPFTKIAVKLSLPIGSLESPRYSEVTCKGVVVRTEDVAEGGFNLAVFFNGITDPERQRISQYISKFLP